ncbi:uncharacterized protein LOC124272202 isoform X2 [Haliotis rubra]|uniref:uncharacterized protein LOC124272202 isoform X2 n=1 Tax=Haliotis rubra TaxID=36100 RepID=UPI001EE5AFEB|nr:uncharacterized protein LOC124272202 isoform X2 [Haliotis rubra]XP_046563311.1 uncharacterized protein LOC124272202 isoform X2 [Haliotis rubra]
MTGIFLLLLATLPVACEGSVYLTGSSTTAVAGQPFTFTCRNGLGRYYYVNWTAQLQNGPSSFRVRTYTDDECRYYFNPSDMYNFTCPLHSPFTLTILDVDYRTHQNSNWTCLVELRGGRSNTVVLDVNVPLKTINLLTSTTQVLNLTEGDTMLLVCETNPTKPPSNITWMKDDDFITTGASSSTREAGGLTVTVGRLTMGVTREFHMKIIYCVGSYEGTILRTNTTLLYVDVPLVEISIINSTNLPLSMTENEDVTLVCETNPTLPLSTIIWTKGNQTLTEDVTSTSRASDGAVVAVSMATFTPSCDDHLSRIQCSGFYKSTRIASKSQTLFVHCISKDETSGPTFSAGVGVGMTICLVPLLVAAAVYILWWKRRHTMKDKTEPPESTDSAAAPQSDDGHNINMYESMDDNARERNDTAYEELHMQVYENTVFEPTGSLEDHVIDEDV